MDPRKPRKEDHTFEFFFSSLMGLVQRWTWERMKQHSECWIPLYINDRDLHLRY
jgi:hypothetical protein